MIIEPMIPPGDGQTAEARKRQTAAPSQTFNQSSRSPQFGRETAGEGFGWG
jgi:hypothetical protein